MDLFWGVTLPIIVTLLGIIFTLIITHRRERGKLDKIEDIAKSVVKLGKLDEIEDITKGIVELTKGVDGLTKGVDDLKKELGEPLKWTLEDFSSKVDKVLGGLVDVVKTLSKSNPHSLENPKSPPDESEKAKE